MKTKYTLAGAIAAAVLVTVGFVACKEEAKAPPPPPAAAAPSPAAPAAAAPAAAAPAAAAPAAGSGAGMGSIEGSVLFTGTAPTMKPLATAADPKCPKGVNDESVIVKGGKLGNVWVHATKGGSAAAAVAAPITVTQHGCMYRPRLQGIAVGQKIVIKNDDDTLHNVHTFLGSSTAFNKAMPGKAAPAIEYVPTEEGMIKWKCDVHPWMRGFVGVAKTSVQGTSGDSGEFKIDNVPPGTYTLEAWHEKFGAKTADVTVEAGKPAKIEFKYDGTEKGS